MPTGPARPNSAGLSPLATATPSRRTRRRSSSTFATSGNTNSAFDYQGSLATGLGYRFINTDKTKFWVQGGPGYRVSKEQDTGDTIDGLIFRGDLGFEQQLTGNTRIVERFLIETGSDNTYLQNNLGLEVMMSGALGLRIGYEVRYNSDVQPGIEKTDTLTTIGLLYETK